MAVTNWIDHLSAKEVAGAVYPGVGTEGVLVLIAFVIWIGWHVIAAKQENEKLIQEKLQLKAELQLAENNTQIQKDTSSRNWFIVGAIVLFFGMMIGFIVPGLLNRKRF